MLATSRMWPSTRWMPAVWWRRLRAGAPAGERRLGRPMPFQTTFPHGRLHHVYTFSSRPIRRWPCLILSGRAVVGAAEAAVPGVVAGVAAVVVQVEAAQAGVVVVAAVVVRAEAAQGVVVKAAPAEVVVPEEAVKAAPAAREAAPAVAVTILSLTTATHHTISRG